MTSSRDNEPAIIAADEPRSRRQLLTAGGVAAIAAALGAVGISTSTEARDGQWMRIGQKNIGAKSTTLQNKRSPGFLTRMTGAGAAIRGYATAQKGVGVQGWADAKKGQTIGVQGKTASPKGTAGEFVATGGGTGLVARSTENNGTALQTEGKLKFGRRSGIAQTSGGAEFVFEVGGGVNENSLVLATLQDHFPGVHVEAAQVLDAKENLVLVRLNQAVPEPARVAWLILD